MNNARDLMCYEVFNFPWTSVCRVDFSRLRSGILDSTLAHVAANVNLTRKHYLTLGPVALVSLCYAIAAPSSKPDYAASLQKPLSVRGEETARTLALKCDVRADVLRQQLPQGWSVAVYESFVLGGDVSERELESLYQGTILPTARALNVQYFDQTPEWPISILLCSSDSSYRQCQQCLGERERNDYSGIYSRADHRIVINLATGEGTLAHELTHALAHADFPSMPEWFDEGLASLHEECVFSENGLRLVGMPNWRRTPLQEALRRGQLRSVIEFTSERFAAPERAHIDYAQSRYLCLYLQERGLLEPFYRKCRSRTATDPTGIHSLCELVHVQSTGEFDTLFQDWLRATVDSPK